MSIINTIGYNNDRKLKKQFVHPKPGLMSSLSPRNENTQNFTKF